MTPQALFDELETLTFAARWKRMLALGRQARADREAQALIAALEASGDFYSRQLALMAAHGSGESRNLVAALTGPSQALFGMAISAAVRYLDDGELAAAIAALPPRRRKVVVIACGPSRSPRGRDGGLRQFRHAGAGPLPALRHAGVLRRGAFERALADARRRRLARSGALASA